MAKLDERGFVFLDDQNKPYWCKMWGDEPWLFYLHPDKRWVSLRKVSQTDVWQFPHNLTEDEQDMYRNIEEAH